MGKLTNRRKPARSGAKRLPPLRPPSKTIEQLAREQGVKPIESFDELNALGEGVPAGEMDEFIEFIKLERAKERHALRKTKRR
jgi:hypothetical protein